MAFKYIILIDGIVDLSIATMMAEKLSKGLPAPMRVQVLEQQSEWEAKS